jgi:hypothetical protein
MTPQEKLTRVSHILRDIMHLETDWWTGRPLSEEEMLQLDALYQELETVSDDEFLTEYNKLMDAL